MNKDTQSQSETKDFAAKVLHSIEEQHIEPKPRWNFLLKEYVVWGVGTVAVIIGGLAVAVIIAVASSGDIDLLEKGGLSKAAGILSLIPLFWVLIVLLFIVAANYYIRHTKHGYRYSLVTLVPMVLLSSLLLGVGFHYTEVGEKIDFVFEERVPYYAEYISPRHKIWTHPEEGRVVGKIILIQEGGVFVIQTIQNNEWTVHATEAEIEGFLQPDIVVRVIGEYEDDEDEDEAYIDAEYIKVVAPERPFGRPGKAPKNKVHIQIERN